MIRIALHVGFTFDFSRPAGTLREDLSKRDFTVNAIAWSPDSGIVDYFHGLDDLSKKRIRAISEENMISDPLRMIRAYRFAAELSGSIEDRTRKIIKSLHGRIKKVSPERITLELFTLLNSINSSKYLKMGLDDGILSRILLLPFKKLENNIREIYKLEKVLSTHPSHRIKVMLNEIYAQNLTNKGLLCLETLLQDGYADPKTIKNLRLSNRIHKHIDSVFQGMKLLGGKRTVSDGVLFDLFMKSKEASRDILIIKTRSDLLGQYEKFKRIWKGGLLTSEEIIHISNLRADPRIGKIIEKVKKAQFEGKIKTRKEAVDFIREIDYPTRRIRRGE
jgi:tRNA nucleotidyltransferase/poly(A) polymerase